MLFFVKIGSRTVRIEVADDITKTRILFESIEEDEHKILRVDSVVVLEDRDGLFTSVSPFVKKG